MKEQFKEYIRSNRKNIITGFLLVLIFLTVFYVKQSLYSPYVLNEDGSVAAVNTEGQSGVIIHVKVRKGEQIMERDVVLSPLKEERGREEKTSADEEEILLSGEIDSIVSSVEKQKGSVLKLPLKGEDGLEICWSFSRNYRPLLLVLLYPAFVFLLYLSGKEKERSEEKKKSDNIKREIPKFCHELVLLLDSGMVFSDAYEKIALSYLKDMKEEDYFKSIITDIYKEEKTGKGSLCTVLTKYSARISDREFSRISSIISDHEYRGSDLRNKLKDESRILWEMRKKNAEAEGKKGETKLSFPLAMQLLVLVIITAAPAFLEM